MLDMGAEAVALDDEENLMKVLASNDLSSGNDLLLPPGLQDYVADSVDGIGLSDVPDWPTQEMTETQDYVADSVDGIGLSDVTDWPTREMKETHQEPTNAPGTQEIATQQEPTNVPGTQVIATQQEPTNAPGTQEIATQQEPTNAPGTQEIATQQYTYQCPICSSFFGTRSSFNRHSKLHNKPMFSCSLCSIHFFENYKLQNHISLVHMSKISRSRLRAR